MIKYFKIKNKIMGFDVPKICVPLVANTREAIIKEAHGIAAASESQTIDMVEFRGDFYDDLGDMDRLGELMCELKDIFSDIIFLFTIRSEAEGGEKLSFEMPSINDINRFVIENQLSDMVDLELCSGADTVEELTRLAHEKDVRIIMSNHDFYSTPAADVMINRLRMMQDMGADVAKIAVMPNNKLQVLELLAATTVMNEKYAEVPIVTISMGKLGAISRLCGQIFGSAITFAALDGASAPGQIPVETVADVMKAVDKYCCE